LLPPPTFAPAWLCLRRVGHPFASAISGYVIQALGRPGPPRGALPPTGLGHFRGTHPQVMPLNPTTNQDKNPWGFTSQTLPQDACLVGAWHPAIVAPGLYPTGFFFPALATPLLPLAWLQHLCKNDLRALLEHIKVKSKAVPLHVMEALGGRGGTAPTHT
jgi:hypothetical protein